MPDSLNAEDANMWLVGADTISKLSIFTHYTKSLVFVISQL